MAGPPTRVATRSRSARSSARSPESSGASSSSSAARSERSSAQSRRLAVFGERDAPRPPVGRVRRARDEPRLLQLVEEVGHHRAVDAQLPAERELAARLAGGGGREHLVAAGPTGQAADDVLGRAQVGPGDRAQRPAELGLDA